MNPSQHYPDQDGQKPNVESVAPEARFQASGYKDVWAAILFLIATAAFGFVSYLFQINQLHSKVRVAFCTELKSAIVLKPR